MKDKLKRIIEKIREQISEILQTVLSFFEPPIKALFEKYPILADGAEKGGAFVSWFGKSLEPIFKGSGRKTIGYIFLFFSALAVFFIAGFDTVGFSNYVEGKVRAKTGYEVSIEKLGFSFPPGLKLKGVTLTSATSNTELKFSLMKLRPIYHSLFTGSPAVRLFVAENEGNLSVDLSRKLFGSKVVSVSVASRKFPLQKVINKIGGKPLPIEAVFDVDGQFAVKKSITDVKGDIAISLSGIKIMGGVFGEGLVKKLSPKSAKCSFSLNKKKLVSKECVASTPLGSVELRLKTTLAKRIARTPLLGSVVIKKPTGFLASLLEMNQKQKKPDGSYVIPMKGTLKNPRLAI